MLPSPIASNPMTPRVDTETRSVSTDFGGALPVLLAPYFKAREYSTHREERYNAKHYPFHNRGGVTGELNDVERLLSAAGGHQRETLNTCLFKFGVKDTRQSSGKSRTAQYGGLIFPALCGCRE